MKKNGVGIMRQQVGSVIAEAQALKVVDEETCEQAGMILSAIKAMRKKIFETILAPAKRAKDEAVKSLETLTETFDAPLEYQWLATKSKVSKYLAEQETARLMETTRLQQEAAAAAKAKSELEALQVEALGDMAAATLIRAEPVVVPLVEAALVARPGNISTVAVWRWRLVDKSKVPDEYKKIDEVMVSKIVRAMNGATNIPRGYSDTRGGITDDKNQRDDDYLYNMIRELTDELRKHREQLEMLAIENHKLLRENERLKGNYKVDPNGVFIQLDEDQL